MGTVGQGYVATYLNSRRQLLEEGAAMATARIDSDQRKYEAERVYYRKMIDGLDDQILEYDKLLAKAVKEREALMRPRTTRVTRGGQRESAVMSNLAGGTKALMGIRDNAAATAENSVSMPAAFGAVLADAVMKGRNEALNPAERQTLAQDAAASILGAKAFQDLGPGQKAKTVAEVGNQLKLIDNSFALNPQAYLTPEEQKLLDPEELENLRQSVYIEQKGPEAEAGMDVGFDALRTRGAFLGGGSYSTTREELAPGEAERQARIQSPEFQAVAAALRDDGRLSEEERAKLEEQGVKPDEYLDDALMQAVARTGLLMSRRGELVSRQAGARADLEALVAPDTSDQRRRELTAMHYGPAGVTATQALFAPKSVHEGMRAERERLTAKQAMLRGVMRAAAGDVPEIDEESNVYAAQLTDAIKQGNKPAIRETFQLMSEAGYDDERLTSSFAVASSRARQLEQRREAQAVAAQE